MVTLRLVQSEITNREREREHGNWNICQDSCRGLSPALVKKKGKILGAGKALRTEIFRKSKMADFSRKGQNYRRLRVLLSLARDSTVASTIRYVFKKDRVLNCWEEPYRFWSRQLPPPRDTCSSHPSSWGRILCSRDCSPWGSGTCRGDSIGRK